MKQLRSAYLDHLKSGVTTLVYCLRLVRQDGAVFRWTSHDRPLTMLDTGAEYLPDQGSPDQSAIRGNSDGQADTFDLEGALTGNGVQRHEIAAGLFDFAKIYLFRTPWTDAHEDDEELVAGYLGKTELSDNRFVTEFRSLAAALDQEIGRTHAPICDADLGDSRCQVRLTPPAWQASTAYSVRRVGEAESGSVIRPTSENGRHFKCIEAGVSGSTEPPWDPGIGSVTNDGSAKWRTIRALTQTDTIAAVTSSGIFTGQLGFPNDWWGSGTVEFTTGDNAGIRREVKTYAADQYTLWAAMPYPIAVGDQIIATAGCRKRFDEDCADKFDDHINNQSYPHLPGENAVNKFGGQ